eukprot:4624233-Pleurochrysis_carterae.AAC.3
MRLIAALRETGGAACAGRLSSDPVESLSRTQALPCPARSRRPATRSGRRLRSELSVFWAEQTVSFSLQQSKQGELALNGPAVTTISALSELPPSKICPAACRSQAKQLVKQMTLKEKAKLCSGSGFWTLDQIPRLNLPQIRVCDGPHGLRKDKGSSHLGLGESVRATCFPTAVALAASWDRTLLNKVGVALGKECAAHDVSVLLGPGVNIKRHPQCGRNFEYFSEDPLLSGELAAAFIQGVQENGIGTSLKHFACNEQVQLPTCSKGPLLY